MDAAWSKKNLSERLCLKKSVNKSGFLISVIVVVVVPDARSRDLPLIDSTWQVPAIIGLYLIAVLKIGPRFMENRKPYDLKNYIRLYNIAQVVLNSAFFLAEVRTLKVFMHKNCKKSKKLSGKIKKQNKWMKKCQKN